MHTYCNGLCTYAIVPMHIYSPALPDTNIFYSSPSCDASNNCHSAPGWLGVTPINLMTPGFRAAEQYLSFHELSAQKGGRWGHTHNKGEGWKGTCSAERVFFHVSVMIINTGDCERPVTSNKLRSGKKKDLERLTCSGFKALQKISQVLSDAPQVFCFFPWILGFTNILLHIKVFTLGNFSHFLLSQHLSDMICCLVVSSTL